MKIIQPSFKLHTLSGLLTEQRGIELLRWIELNARISHKAEDAQTADSYKRFIQSVVVEHGDWSVTEHASVTAIIRTDRGITHELVRHRLFSFTQESTRFVNGDKKYPFGLEFICPIELVQSEKPESYLNWILALQQAEQSYSAMLAAGSRPQEARSVLPNSLAATISVTGNLRNWRHLLLMRTTKETHPDFKRITIPMLEVFKKQIPILYDDIQPDARQIDNLKKAR